MEYRYKTISNGKEFEKIERSSAEMAEINAVLWLAELGGSNTVIIEKRRGILDPWRFYLKITFNKPSNRTAENNKNAVHNLPYKQLPKKIKRLYLLDNRKLSMLEREPKPLRELIELLIDKKSLLPQSPMIEITQRRIRIILNNFKTFGINMDFVYDKLKYYQVTL